MDLKQQILHYYRVDELSLREISRRTETDRKTVTRLINAYEKAIKENPETGIEDFLASRPKYKSRTYVPRVVMDDISKEIDKWLKEETMECVSSASNAQTSIVSWSIKV